MLTPPITATSAGPIACLSSCRCPAAYRPASAAATEAVTAACYLLASEPPPQLPAPTNQGNPVGPVPPVPPAHPTRARPSRGASFWAASSLSDDDHNHGFSAPRAAHSRASSASRATRTVATADGWTADLRAKVRSRPWAARAAATAPLSHRACRRSVARTGVAHRFVPVRLSHICQCSVTRLQ
jgi:hypothetical protein